MLARRSVPVHRSAVRVVLILGLLGLLGLPGAWAAGTPLGDEFRVSNTTA